MLIEAGKIREIRPNLPAGESTAVVDAANMIVLPGFVDTHHHSYQGILRNILPNGILADYFRDIIGVLTPAYEPNDAYAGTLVTALGAVVTLMDTGNVDTVFVAGRVKKWRGRLVGVDPARVRRLVQEARDALVRRSGFALNVLP